MPGARSRARTAKEIKLALRLASGISRLDGPATAKQLGYLKGLLAAQLGETEGAIVARHQVLEQLFGSGLTKAEASAAIEWLVDPEIDAAAEVQAVLQQWSLDHGQLELDLGV